MGFFIILFKKKLRKTSKQVVFSTKRRGSSVTGNDLAAVRDSLLFFAFRIEIIVRQYLYHFEAIQNSVSLA